MTMTHCIWDFTALSPKVDGCEILHQLIGGESHYLYPRWCRISQPSTVCRLCRLRLTSSHPFANPLYIASPHTWVFHILNYACAKKDKTKTTLANTLRICPNTHVQCIYILSYCQVQHTKHPKISKHVQDITCPTLGKCHTKTSTSRLWRRSHYFFMLWIESLHAWWIFPPIQYRYHRFSIPIECWNGGWLKKNMLAA